MSVALGREIFLIEVWHFAALLLILGVNSWFYRNAEKNGLLYRYLLLQGALLLWVVSKMLKSVAPTVSLRWLAIVSQYLGVSFLGPFFFLFSWRYVYGREACVRIRLLTYAPSLFFFMVILTNPYHHLFYATYTFYRDTFGPLFYGLSIYTYGLIIGGTLLFLQGMRRHHKMGSSGDLFVALSAVLPLLINAAYIYKLFKQHFDYTPLFMTCSLAFFGWGAFRSGFLGVLPAAWKTLLMELEDPLILTDRKGEVLRVIKLSPGTLPRTEIVQGGRVYRLQRKKRGRKGILYQYADVTDIEALKKTREEKNKQLEASIEEIKRRNRKTVELMKADLLQRSRRELHDILGHSLTQVIYLLRMEKVDGYIPESGGRDRSLVRSIITNGLEQLDGRLRGEVWEGNSFSIALGDLLNSLHLPEVKVEFLLRGNERPLPELLVGELMDCCREGLTNAVKHGRAERIDLVLLYGKKRLAFLISDNGCGCGNCRPGNGLSLMREGLARFGGSFACWSEKDEGYQLTIRVPYPAIGDTLERNTEVYSSAYPVPVEAVGKP